MAASRTDTLRALAAGLSGAVRHAKKQMNDMDQSRFLSPVVNVVLDIASALDAYKEIVSALDDANQDGDGIASRPHGAPEGPSAGSSVGADAPTRTRPEACEHTPPLADGVFRGRSIGVVGSQPGSIYVLSVVEKIRQNGGIAVAPEAVAGARLDACVCCDVLDLPRLRLQTSVPLATVRWLDACVSDGTLYPHTAFPHFEPSNGALPVQGMQDCCVRITALEGSAEGKQKRVHIEELAGLAGARVLQNGDRMKNLTHVICVSADFFDKKQYDDFVRRNILVVTVQWLYECFRTRARQPEGQFSISRLDSSDLDFAATVLRGHNVLISLAALGSNAQLPRMAEELGAVASTCSADELQAELERCHAPGAEPDVGGSAAPGPGGEGRCGVVVLVDREEVRSASGALARCLAAFPREIFVQPTWLLETFSQRRTLPLEGFAALPAAEAVELPAKRTRLDEATYAWQSEASTRLNAFAEDSRARELESKAELKAAEGLRLAELQREPSRGA